MKKLMILSGLMVVSIALNGCGIQAIVYDGKERPVQEVEEIMADKLEVENPNLDLNVSISQDSE